MQDEVTKHTEKIHREIKNRERGVWEKTREIVIEMFGSVVDHFVMMEAAVIALMGGIGGFRLGKEARKYPGTRFGLG